MMKRITAFALVLVFVLTACAIAFADYYPTVKFASSSKNKYVRYGDRYTLRVKCKQGTGPFGKTTSLFHKPILRAGLTVVASKGNNKNKLVDWDFYGDTTYKKRFWTDEEFPDPVWGIDRYTLTATSWYKPTIGTVVYGFKKYKSVTTKLYLYASTDE